MATARWTRATGLRRQRDERGARVHLAVAIQVDDGRVRRVRPVVAVILSREVLGARRAAPEQRAHAEGQSEVLPDHCVLLTRPGSRPAPQLRDATVVQKSCQEAVKGTVRNASKRDDGWRMGQRSSVLCFRGFRYLSYHAR